MDTKIVSTLIYERLYGKENTLESIQKDILLAISIYLNSKKHFSSYFCFAEKIYDFLIEKKLDVPFLLDIDWEIVENVHEQNVESYKRGILHKLLPNNDSMQTLNSVISDLEYRLSLVQKKDILLYVKYCEMVLDTSKNIKKDYYFKKYTEKELEKMIDDVFLAKSIIEPYSNMIKTYDMNNIIETLYDRLFYIKTERKQ